MTPIHEETNRNSCKKLVGVPCLADGDDAKRTDENSRKSGSGFQLRFEEMFRASASQTVRCNRYTEWEVGMRCVALPRRGR